MSKKSSRKKSRYTNRELSWLEFNDRVLQEALDAHVPLLERLKFLAITSSNLDEFFMVRVGGLQMMLAEGISRPDATGLTPAAQLRAIADRTHRMLEDQQRCYLEELEPALIQAGIARLRPTEFDDRQREYVRRVLENEIFPVVTPMAVDEERPFPLVRNLELHLAVRIKPAEGESGYRHAIIPLGASVRRFITLPAKDSHCFVLIEDLLDSFIAHFFPGEKVMECVTFRITRNADVAVREDMAADLMEGMQEVLDERKQSHTVRLEIEEPATKLTENYLRKRLGIKPRDIYRSTCPLMLSDFMEIAFSSDAEQLTYEAWPPQPCLDIDPTLPVFDSISERNILLCHPYDTFDPVIRMLQEAADDPEVLAIKQILYRTSKNSPVVAALKRAAENGKYVTAIVELKARFDEAQNIEWAQHLEQAGVQVIYGVKGLKTHAKVLIIIRREANGLTRYMHFGTGNYNEKTAKLYSDISYMTCDEMLGQDASMFFNAITGFSQPQQFHMLEAAPIGLRDRVIELIEIEAERKKQGQKAFIMAKLNSLVDRRVIDALYAASQAGVKIQLNIRGICCLRPGVKGLSENIQVSSIIDRYLEHARIMYFRHGGDAQLFISSADWMPRNLDRRVELLVPVVDRRSKKSLESILKTYFTDNQKSWALGPDGVYTRTVKSGRKRKRSQQELYERARRRVKEAEAAPRTMFEPHRPAGR